MKNMIESNEDEFIRVHKKMIVSDEFVAVYKRIFPYKYNIICEVIKAAKIIEAYRKNGQIDEAKEERLWIKEFICSRDHDDGYTIDDIEKSTLLLFIDLYV